MNNNHESKEENEPLGTFTKYPAYDKSIIISNLVPVKTNNRQLFVGNGTFSEVYLAKDIETNRLYAVKHMEKSLLLKTLHTLQITYNEIALHSCLIHKNIIRLYNIYENQTSIYLIMEYASNGSLYTFLKRNGPLTEKEAHKYFFQIAKTVSFLHKNNIIHRDIKPENLLFDDDYNIKLCDFGWACSIDYSKERSTFCGTMEYMAPEILNKENYSKGIDIWALGILLFELVHGHPPFGSEDRHMDYHEMLEEIKINGFVTKSGVSDNYCDLLNKMLEIDSSKRITIEDVLQHPFVKMIGKSGEKKNRVRAYSEKNLDKILSPFQKQQPSKISNFTKMLLGNDLSFLEDEESEIIKPPMSTKNKIHTPKKQLVLKFNVCGAEKKKLSFSAIKSAKTLNGLNPNKLDGIRIKYDEQRNTCTSSNDLQKETKRENEIEKIDQFLDNFL